MTKLCTVLSIMCALLPCGCSDDNGSSVKNANVIDCAIEIQVVIRSEPYEPGEEINDGLFQVVSSNVVPIRSVGGPGTTVSNADGTMIHVTWDDVALLDDRYGPLIRFDRLRWELNNRIVRPDRVTHKFGSVAPDVAGNTRVLQTHFEYLVGPLLYFLDGTERLLAIRARYLPSPPSVRDIVIEDTLPIQDAG